MKKYMIYGFKSEMTGAWTYCAMKTGDSHCSYVGSWTKAVWLVASWQGRYGGDRADDHYTAADRDELAREQREQRRIREEYLTEERDTYGTTED